MTCDTNEQLLDDYRALLAERVDTDSLDAMISWCDRFDAITAEQKRHRGKCDTCRRAWIESYQKARPQNVTYAPA
jgi:hypothetical protein